MNIKRYVTFVLIIIGLLAGTAAGLWLSKRGETTQASETLGPPKNLSRASPGAQPAHVKETNESAVTIEEFADFQCPPCARLHGEIKKLEKDYGAKLRIIFRHFPLTDIHEQAVDAALASEAAAQQGKFWEMYDLLYERQNEWSEQANARQIFVGYANSIGLNTEKFTRDINDPKLKERVQADKQRGESIDIEGTPTLFINGKEIQGEAMTPGGIRAVINAAIQ